MAGSRERAAARPRNPGTKPRVSVQPPHPAARPWGFLPSTAHPCCGCRRGVVPSARRLTAARKALAAASSESVDTPRPRCCCCCHSAASSRWASTVRDRRYKKKTALAARPTGIPRRPRRQWLGAESLEPRAMLSTVPFLADSALQTATVFTAQGRYWEERKRTGLLPGASNS